MAALKTTDDAAAAELSRRVEDAANAALRDVRERHAKNGIPMASWRDGRVVWIDPVTLKEVATPEFAASSNDRHSS